MTVVKPVRRLRELLEGTENVSAARDREINGLQSDSRRVVRGNLFLAFPGMVADGRDYIGDAVANGASAVVYENGDGFVLPGAPVPVFAVTDLRRHLGGIASRFYDAPSSKLIVIGVTGTNGKTTCTHLLAQALDNVESRASEFASPSFPASGSRNISEGMTESETTAHKHKPLGRCAIIGTLGNGYPDTLHASPHTTPDALTIQRLLSDYLNQGTAHIAMEVSSHALDQGRVNGVAFDVAVFTNLTRDHLDYHGDMHDYGMAKAGLFAMEGLKYAVINQDDAFGRDLLAKLDPRVKAISYGLEQGDVRALEVKPTANGLVLRVTTPSGTAELHSPLIGRFNAYNLLAVLATLLILGMNLPQAVARLAQARPPSGRVERFGGDRGQPLVIVDYAHTPDALEKILAALREHTPGRLWCVFGCGGDRDRGKRPAMGAIAERLADIVVLTDDNPRHESGDAIIAEILSGMRNAPQVIRDRRTAIQTALASARPQDVVLIAGKGHEDYQQIGDRRLPYSDRDVVRDLLGQAA